MTDIQLTDQQQNYLLSFTEANPTRTIIEMSQLFDCSRPNAKKMLDRLVKAGILYKQKNEYMVTEIGRLIKERLEDERHSISLTIQGVFGVDEAVAADMSQDLIGKGDDCIACFLTKKAKYFKYLPEPSGKISPEQLEEMLEEKTYPVHLSIFQQHVDENEAVIRESMASMVFEHRAELVIGTDSHVVFTTRPLKKEHKGYLKQGSVREMAYQKEGESFSVTFKDRRANIPLDAFGEWIHLGGGVLVSYTWFRSYAAINFSGHRQEANYLLVLNLAQC